MDNRRDIVIKDFISCKMKYIALALILLVSFSFTVNGIGEYNIYAASKVILSQEKAELYVGESIKLNLSGAKGDVAWSSAKTGIAKVSNSGKVTAIAEGTTTVSAVYSGKKYKCKITVKNASLSPSKMKLIIGETSTIKVNGGGSISFSSSNKKIATVSSSGKVTAKSAGSAVITVSLGNGNELKCKVTVKASELTAKEVYSKCCDSVVEIDAGTAIGSGFFITKNTVVTNFHVINNATSLSIKTIDNKKHKVLKVVGYSEKYDLAILEVDCKKTPLKKNTHDVTIGEITYTIGSSLGLSNTFSDGMVTNNSRKIDGVRYIQTNTAISPGNSGGPLINAYGEVIGVTRGSYEQGQNINLAINIEELDKVKTNKPLTVKQFINKNTNSKPDLTAMLIYTGSDYSSLCGLVVKNNGAKKLKIGGKSGNNIAIVYPYSDATYTGAYLIDPNSNFISIDYVSVGSGKTEYCYYLLDEKRFFSSGATIAFLFEYGGVTYLGVADEYGNTTWEKYEKQ